MSIKVSRSYTKRLSWPHLIFILELIILAWTPFYTLMHVWIWGVSLAVLLALIIALWMLLDIPRMLSTVDINLTHWFCTIVDSIGLQKLNITLGVVAIITSIFLYQIGNIQMVIVSGTIALIAFFGAKYKMDPPTETAPVTIPDDIEFTLPLGTKAPVKTKFNWVFVPAGSSSVSDGSMSISTIVTESRTAAAAGIHVTPADITDISSLIESDLNPQLSVIARCINIEYENKVKSGVITAGLFNAIWNVLCFTQQFKLITDIDSLGRKDYIRFPSEVIWEREGTGICMMITVAVLLRHLRLPNALVWVEDTTGGGRLVLAIPGFDHIGIAGEYWHDPETGCSCALCEPLPAGDGAKWKWVVGPVAEKDKGLPKYRITISAV